jgi:hypothetical protein
MAITAWATGGLGFTAARATSGTCDPAGAGEEIAAAGVTRSGAGANATARDGAVNSGIGPDFGERLDIVMGIGGMLGNGDETPGETLFTGGGTLGTAGAG